IKVTYTYDLNDGVGEQELVVIETVITLTKATPEVVVSNVVPTQESVTFDIIVTDSDNVGEIIAIELYQGETLVEALTDLTLREFSDLLSNNTYQIKVTYTYDLNDGVGEQELSIVIAFDSLIEGLEIIIINNEVVIIDYIGDETNLIIPDKIGDMLITTIHSNAFSNNDKIESLVLGKYITTIGDYAFYNMINLKYLELPNSAQQLGTHILFQTNSLEKLVISSESPYELKYYFGNNINFVPESLKILKYADGATFIDKILTQNNMKGISLHLADDWVKIDESQFEKSQFLVSIFIPANVVSIGERAFFEAAVLEIVGIQENSNLKKVGQYAFYGTPSLTTIELQNATVLEIIDAYSFSYATALKSIYIPDSVQEIGIWAFGYATSLKSAFISENSQLKTIKLQAFYYTIALEEIYIPQSVIEMQSGIFFSARNLIIFTKQETKPIGWDSNWNQTNNTVFWGYIETLDNGVMKYATASNNTIIILGLSEHAGENIVLTIPNNIDGMEVIQIAANAFRNENRLLSVQIPNTITEIKSNTFAYAVN
ncbi:MAG: leucine-rich repeat domain-containing protein, partial [Acholeplasmataceae bacterium]|nr:leucine-rich repeat domain-containing protein [Acholeplasmataceae bacterium]